MGGAENKLSSTLRNSSSLMQTIAAEIVVKDIMTVEVALRGKLRQTEQLKTALEAAIVDTVSEAQECVALKASLEQRLSAVEHKAELNASRMQVRNGRPNREKTMDDVEGTLLNQQGLMGAFAEKVRRSMAQIDREVEQLEHIRRKLEADVRDKADAIDVDTKVLNVQPDGYAGEAGALHRKSDVSYKTPNTWVSSTDDNIKSARRWIADSVRLRKAIRIAVQGARSADHDISRSLNAQMMTKIGQTRGLKSDLERQLGRVKEEASRAQSQRSSLIAALEAKRGPLQQAKERFQARKARPDREMVQDDVEAALTQEIAHLNAVTSQLSQKLVSVDKTISNLDLAAFTLEDNIADKETTLSMEERMALLDGRINLTTPPPSSVGSFAMSAISEVRDATIRRINDLEGELMTARREREMLEANITQFKAGLQ